EEYTFTLPLHARGATEAQFLFMTESGTLATSAPSVRVGYSNVAFLPGIQSSFLYREGVVGDNQLWLPNIGVGTDGDLEDLFMDADGTSVRSDIYTRDAGIIEKAYGFRDVYEGFPVYMNSLVADDTIAAWKPIAYDWRLSFDELLTHGAVDGGGKIDYNQDGTYILDQLRTLASTSDNGRVTIVAHSHGGLLTKAVLKKLEEAGDPLLQKIDTVIFVGVPHLGTPKALLPTLHGAENALSTLSLDDATWRAAAKNSPGALMLLPSREYHEAAESTALVTFDDSLNALQETIRLRDELSYTGEGLEAVVDYRIRYGNDIRSYDEMQEFLEGVGRTAPLYADVLHPENLAPTLLGDAEAAHAALDAWSPQDVNGDGVPDIRVVNVVGTGLATIKGVSYITAPHLFACAPECSLRVPVRAVQAVPEFSSRGDGTVMVESADYGQGDTVYFDISNYNLTRELVGDSVERDHSNVMGAQPIRNLISATLRDDATPSPYLENVLPASRAVTVVEMHSPVAMEVRDATGNRVGAIYNAELGTTTFEATIPNSTYERVGQSTFIVVPTGPAYTVKLDGMASGTFTMKVKNYEADQLVASTTFTAVPTTAALLGSAILGTTTAPTVLQLDTNGDGVTDVVRKPDGTQSETALTAIKDFKTLLGTTAMSKRLKGTLSLLTFTTEQLIVARKYNLARISIGVMKQVIEKGVKTNDISRANADILTVQLNKVMLLLK
ncbi:MAG: hypothetical protein RLZZ234_557, partial [Candidatus Parcubacteria bacterium]